MELATMLRLDYQLVKQYVPGISQTLHNMAQLKDMSCDPNISRIVHENAESTFHSLCEDYEGPKVRVSWKNFTSMPAKVANMLLMFYPLIARRTLYDLNSALYDRGVIGEIENFKIDEDSTSFTMFLRSDLPYPDEFPYTQALHDVNNAQDTFISMEQILFPNTVKIHRMHFNAENELVSYNEAVVPLD